jgi:hypothetical protein
MGVLTLEQASGDQPEARRRRQCLRGGAEIIEHYQ